MDVNCTADHFPPAKDRLTPKQITDLCDHAQAAMSAMAPRQRVARFEWNGKRYRAVHTGFRLQVQSAGGKRLIAYRWD